MRYLKLFEAFGSEILSKTIKFLDKKLNKEQSVNFISSLKEILSMYEVPIDKIKDEDVDYLSGKKALRLKKDSNLVENKWGISYLKFWFSIEDGFLGWTATGADKVPFHSRSRYSGSKFSRDQISYIKDELGIKTGTLTPVKDYQKLKTGNKVIGLFDGDKDSYSRISLATIWREGDRLWAIQDVASGGEPNQQTQTIDGETVRWSDYGRTHWSLGDVQVPGDDHYFLTHYKDDDKPLSYFDEKESENKEDFNPYEWNVPVDGRGKLSNWSRSGTINSTEDLDKSDFCIVVDLDKILSDKKSVAITRKERVESREGATKLLSDREILNMNISRYIGKILSGMDIKPGTKEVRNLQKLMSRFVRGKYSLISINNNRPSIEYISRFSNNIKNLISSSEDDAEYYIDRIIADFSSIQNYKAEQMTSFNETEKIVRKSELLSEVFDKIYEIGEVIDNYFSKVEINTYQDLKVNIHIFGTIRDILDDRDLKLSTLPIQVMSAFESDVDYYIRRYEYSESDKKEDLKKLSIIERFVKRALG